MSDIGLFALSAGNALAEGIAQRLELALSPLEEMDFADGEHHARPLDEVDGKDVYVVASLHAEAGRSIDDKLLRLLFLVATLADAGAERITAVLPYLCYARKDRQTQPRDPVVTRYLARLFEAAGTFGVITLDVHNPAAFQNAWRCRTGHLEAGPLFAAYVAERLGADPLVVVSPDSGGVKRAERFRRQLGLALGSEPPLAFMEKHRVGGELRGQGMVGDVAGRTAIVFDDLISTGATLLRAALACRERGAHRVFGAASHGVFAAAAEVVVANAALDRIVVSDSIAPLRLSPGVLRAKVDVLGAAPLFADAIAAMHAAWRFRHG